METLLIDIYDFLKHKIAKYFALRLKPCALRLKL
jgi:hypothetical protein